MDPHQFVYSVLFLSLILLVCIGVIILIRKGAPVEMQQILVGITCLIGGAILVFKFLLPML